MSDPNVLQLGRVSPVVPAATSETGEARLDGLDITLMPATHLILGTAAAMPSLEVMLGSADQMHPLLKNLEILRADRAHKEGRDSRNPGIMVMRSIYLTAATPHRQELQAYQEADRFENGGKGLSDTKLLIVDDTIPELRRSRMNSRSMAAKYIVEAATKVDRMAILLVSTEKSNGMRYLRNSIAATVELDEAGEVINMETNPGSAKRVVRKTGKPVTDRKCPPPTVSDRIGPVDIASIERRLRYEK